MSGFLDQLLRQRRECTGSSRYVFPSEASKSGHLVNAYKGIDKIRAESGVHFMLHDLRRTFITIAAGLDICAYAVKRLANHKMAHDVTAGYIVADVVRLPEPMQKISNFILKAAGAKPTAAVIPFHQATSGEQPC